MELKRLIGSGEKIGLATLPFLVAGLVLNVARPGWFHVGGPPPWLALVSLCLLAPGVAIWGWSVFLIATKAGRGELITTGPYALVKHPLYTGVSLLVLPAGGFLLNTWLGIPLALVMYGASRRYAPEEEHVLARTFGAAWEEYCRSVRWPWL